MAAAVLQGDHYSDERLEFKNLPVLLLSADIGMECEYVIAEMGEQTTVVRQVEAETGKDVTVCGFVLTPEKCPCEIIGIVQEFKCCLNNIPSSVRKPANTYVSIF